MDVNAITQTLSEFSNLIVSITGLALAVVAAVKPIRMWIVAKISDSFAEKSKIDTILSNVKSLTTELHTVKETMAEQDVVRTAMKKAIVATLRNDITAIYYKARDEGGIGDYNRENFIKLCEVYFNMNGNCYIHDIYKEVVKMPRLTARRRATKRK